MTKPNALVSAPYQEHTASLWGAYASRCLMVSSVLALAACSSTPLPPWPSTPARTSSTSTAPANSPVGTTAANVVSINPVAPNKQLEVLPYSAEIAALFPEPAEHYNTPGLSEGRRSFTTNAELAELLQTLSQQNSDHQPRLGLLQSGNAQSGAPIYALVASKGKAISATALEETNLPTVMIVAGQQGTDAAATEALLVLAKELGTGGSLTNLLDKINVIFVPRANPDGFDKGTASTANGTDLRFDHLLLQTPEARFLAKLARDYRPAVLLDIGEFAAIGPNIQRLNAVRANDVGLQYALTPNAHEFITKAAREWMHEPTAKALSQAGLRVDWAFDAVGSNAQDGYAMGTLDPTTLHNASSLKHVVSMEADSRGGDLGRTHLQRRVYSHVKTITTILQTAAQRGSDLRKVHAFVTRDIASQACRSTLTVQALRQLEQRDIAMVDVSSAQLVQKQVPWRSSMKITNPRTRSTPCGYWLSANAIEATERLSMLGINVERVGELSSIQAEVYQSGTSTPSNGNTVPTVTLSRTTVEAAPGSFYISMNQPLAYLAAAALEPDTPYSYYSNGVIKHLAETARVVVPPNIVFDEE